jgi:hypothetical protein
MRARDNLHRLIEDLPDSEIPRAERVLQALKETAQEVGANWLEHVREDDEPETADEMEAVAEAWREHREGKSLTTEELKRHLGLS